MAAALREKGDRRCPVCQAQMAVHKKGKIEVDVCDAHGVWLDQGELEELERRAMFLEMMRGKSAVRKAHQEGKVKGALFGWLSLYFD